MTNSGPAVAGDTVISVRDICTSYGARRVLEHIDLDVSGLLQREKNMDQCGDELIQIMLRTCNGRLTCAEALGHREFVMTRLYESA